MTLTTPRNTRFGVQLFLMLIVLMATLGLSQAQDTPPSIPTEPVTWDGQSRINILVLGMDRRPGARDNLNARTDAIMIVSYDPATQRIGMLNIPRDMHFAIIGAEDELVRVNTLLVRGESRLEGYGPYFAMQTLQLNLGMYLDAYVAFDFEAFITVVDALGGVTVEVPYTISDPTFPDMNYGFDPLYIRAGTQHLDGHTALQYSRTRHNDSDYQRGERQMQVVLAMRDQVRDPLRINSLIQGFPELMQDLDGHVYTNLALDQFVPLGLAMMAVPTENIYTGSINQDYSYNYPYRQEVVRVPDRNLLTELLTRTFGEDYWR